MSDNAERALALARLGLHIFPCWETGDSLKAPRTEHGFLEATTDPDQIRRWWDAAPDALIGVAAGASGLHVADVDHKPEKDGAVSLKAVGLWPLAPTYWYETQSGGFHFVYAATGPAVGPTKDHKHEDGTRGLGRDRRSGGSYFIWWDEAWPDSRTEFAPAPEWFCNSVGTVGEEWGGTLGEWLAGPGAGQPDALMRAVIESKTPRGDFGRAELWARMVHIIRLAGEGHPGAAAALSALEAEWLRPPWNVPKYRTEWNVSLGNAVGSNGGMTERSAEIVEHVEALTNYDFFDQTSHLIHIRQWAQAQLVNPWAALLVVLTRLSADLPPQVQLPRIGSLPKGSLNQFSALSGASGAGKSALMTGVDENLWPRPPWRHDPAKRFSPSSGEGLITRFVRRRRKDGEMVDERVAWQALAMLDEIDALETLGSRSGNMLLSTLKTLWTGGAIGTANATEDRDRNLEAHTYRLALMVGIQPGLGGVLFDKDAVTGGLPQRFVFATVNDPTLTMDSETPEDPGVLRHTISEEIPFDPIMFGTPTQMPRPDHNYIVPVATEIVKEIIRTQKEIRLGVTDSLRGHWLFAKLRVAALLSILHGGSMVDEVWWELADGVMRHSDETREKLIADYGRSMSAENEAKGKGDASRALAAEYSIVNRTADRIIEIMRAEGGETTITPIKSKLTKSMRENCDAAMAQLAAQGRIIKTADATKVRKKGSGERWSLV